jgi:hypothetical protein
MPKRTSVVVVKPLSYQGRSYVRGDRVEMRPAEALALRRKGLITLTRGAQVERAPDPVPEPVRRRRPARRKAEDAPIADDSQAYRTRHLVAETPGTE